jgi:hypothetical protein
MSQAVARPPGPWTLWVARPVAALMWLIREACSRRKTYLVYWRDVVTGDERVAEVRFATPREALEFCRGRGYWLVGRMNFRIEPCPLARWLAGGG